MLYNNIRIRIKKTSKINILFNNNNMKNNFYNYKMKYNKVKKSLILSKISINNFKN